jgi:hypothetical protein
MDAIASARASLFSLSTSNPVSPSITASVRPPLRVATTGRPIIAASTATKPNPSITRDGITTMVAELNRAGILSDSTQPVKSTMPVIPSSAACRSSADRAGPSLAIISRKQGKRSMMLANAVKTRSKPFS